MSRFAVGALVAAVLTGGLRPPLAVAQPVDFNREVRPILSGTCFRCHGPDEGERKADLRLDTFDGATADLGGSRAVSPGKPDASELLVRIVSDDKSKLMPPPKAGTKLTAQQVEILTRWIKQGGKYATHWSHVAPVRPTPPKPGHPVDTFLLVELQKLGLEFQPEADRNTLARRVALDLTGLPPTADELTAFLADKSPDAYGLFVDKMLAKPAYGEHAARLWLDIARYADSAGYADDPPRVIWKFRDYVIRSLNANKPFDRFTVEQIAGDLLPNPTDEQLTATAFHRNTLTNNEGGTSDEEFRNVAVVDRVNTTMTAWMGTSIACAQCHTHKYDPLSQKEYFQLFAIFNNTADADRKDESPVIGFPDSVSYAKRFQLRVEQVGLEAKVKGQKPDAMKAERDRLAEVKRQIAAVPAGVTVPVMRELTGKSRRTTRVHNRGNFEDLGDAVTENVPTAFPPLPVGMPKDRLALAEWLVSEKNPLTARVTVNRHWEQLFGIGIVRTAEEFGSQGELPTHPQLLDWLATEYVRLKWDTKAFLKLLVTSAAYKQSSRVTPILLERDPENRFLSRGPRVRLTAEMVRDQALAVSGLLSPKMYGPPVKPPQPPLGLTAAFGGSVDWTTSTGEDRYRRGVYTEWRRTNPYASMATFDAPNRDVCTVRRAKSNTPLQALVTMNDAVYVEAAQALARKITSSAGDVPAKVRFAVQQCLCRPATDAESSRLLKLYYDARAAYSKDRPKATKMATDPLGPLPAGADAVDLAAWTVVGNVLLNLDEMFLKR